MLVMHGANVESRDFDSSTPIEIAKIKNREKIEEFLKLVRRARAENDEGSENYEDYDFVYSSSEVEEDYEEVIFISFNDFKTVSKAFNSLTKPILIHPNLT